MGVALPDVFDFGEGLYRGDTYVYTHYFNDNPPGWEPSASYTAGDLAHGVGEVFQPMTTCTFQGVTYTCIADHTSGDTFDPTMWKADKQALGPETDISGYEFSSQYRTDRTASAKYLGSDFIEFLTDGTDGALRRTLTSETSARLVSTQANHKVEWDLEARLPDADPEAGRLATVKTMLQGSPKVTGDVTHPGADL